jgi:hypothetical protein
MVAFDVGNDECSPVFAACCVDEFWCYDVYDLGIGLIVIPKKKPLILQTVCRYFCNSGSLALKFF